MQEVQGTVERSHAEHRKLKLYAKTSRMDRTKRKDHVMRFLKEHNSRRAKLSPPDMPRNVEVEKQKQKGKMSDL